MHTEVDERLSEPVVPRHEARRSEHRGWSAVRQAALLFPSKVACVFPGHSFYPSAHCRPRCALQAPSHGELPQSDRLEASGAQPQRSRRTRRRRASFQPSSFQLLLRLGRCWDRVARRQLLEQRLPAESAPPAEGAHACVRACVWEHAIRLVSTHLPIYIGACIT